MSHLSMGKAGKRRSELTAEGAKFRDVHMNVKGVQRPTYVPGLHYRAIAEEDRILLPEDVAGGDAKAKEPLGAIGALRHCWCWEKRSRPYVPVWVKKQDARAQMVTDCCLFTYDRGRYGVTMPRYVTHC